MSTQSLPKRRFASSGAAVAAFWVCCLILLALPGMAKANEPVVYVEPLTGSRITLPLEFSENTNTAEISGQYGKSIQWVRNAMQPDAANFDVSVKEVGAKSINDVLNAMVFRPQDTKEYSILELSANSIVIDRREESFGDVEFSRHWAWLLDDGSFLHVVLIVKAEQDKRLADAAVIEFGAEKNEKSPGLMTAFAAPDKTEMPFAGKWRNAKTQTLLEGYGKALLNFRAPDGAPLAFGYNDVFWESVTLWGTDVSKCGLVAETPDKIVLSNAGEQLDGEYERLADEGWAEPKTPVYEEGDLRGEWENDTEFCLLQITRSGINVNTETSSASYGGYEVTPEGLRFGPDDLYIRATPDGGLVMDGRPGVFYRAGQGKGVSRFEKFAPYNGSWVNKETNIRLMIENGGTAYTEGDSVGVSTASVDADGYLHTMQSRAHIDPDSGNLVFERIESEDGIEGVFVREGGGAEDEANKSKPGSDASDCAAIIYLHANYEGTSQCLQPGSYDVDYLENNGIGNDQLSSIKVTPGHTITIYEHAGFGGESVALDADSEFVGDEWNDRVSSIVVE